jgi:hypothetical protein
MAASAPSASYVPSAPSMDFTCDPLVNSKCDLSVCDSDSDSDSEEESPVTFSVEKYTNENANAENLILEVEEVNTKSIQLNPSTSDNVQHLTVEEIQVDDPIEITLNLDNDTSETNYSKMSMKQLKEVLSSKGIKPKTNSKKEELIELITKDISS